MTPPEKQKILKVRKGEVFLKWKLAVFIIKTHNASRGSPPPQKLLDRAQKKSKSQKTKKNHTIWKVLVYMSKPPKIFWAPPFAQISQIETKKAQNDPSKVKIAIVTAKILTKWKSSDYKSSP